MVQLDAHGFRTASGVNRCAALDLKSFRPRAAQQLLYLGLGDSSRLEHVVAAIDIVRLPGDEFRRVAGEKEN